MFLLIISFFRDLIVEISDFEKNSRILALGLNLALVCIICLMLVLFYLPEYMTVPSYIAVAILCFSFAYFWGYNWFTGLDNLPNVKYFNWDSSVGLISNMYFAVDCVPVYFATRSTMKHRKQFQSVDIYAF